MFKEKKITFTGITNVPLAHDSHDGDMDILLNLIPDDGALRPLVADDPDSDAAAERAAWSVRTGMTVNAVTHIGDMTCIVGDTDIVYAMPDGNGDHTLFRRSDLLYDIELSQERQELTEVQTPLTDTLMKYLQQPTALVSGQQGTVSRLFPYDTDAPFSPVGMTMILAAIESMIDQSLAVRHVSWHKHVTFGMAVLRLFDGTLLHGSNWFALLPADHTRTVVADMEHRQLSSTTYLHTHQVSVSMRSDHFDADTLRRIVRSIDIYLTPPVSLTEVDAATELQTDNDGVAVRITYGTASESRIALLPGRLPLRHALSISPDDFGTAVALPRVASQATALDLCDLRRQSFGAGVAASYENRLCLGQVSATLPHAFIPMVRYRYPTLTAAQRLSMDETTLRAALRGERLCGIRPDIDDTASGRMADVIVRVHLSIGGQTQTVIHRHDLAYPIAGPLMYPDRRAFAMELWLRLPEGDTYTYWHRSVRLQPSPSANYSVCLAGASASGHGSGQGLPSLLLWQQVRSLTYDATTGTYRESQSLFDRIDAATFATMATEAEEHEAPTAVTNELLTSAAYRPLDIDLGQGITVGNGAIVAFSTNTRRYSGIQFGAFPLLVFTTNGLWALQSGNDGAWRSKYLVSQSTTTAAANVVAMADQVLFWTADGLMSAIGNKLSCLWQGVMSPMSTVTRQLPHWDAVIAAIFPPDIATAIAAATSESQPTGTLTAHGQAVYCRQNVHLSMVCPLHTHRWGAVLHGLEYSDDQIPVVALTRPLHFGDDHHRKHIGRWWCCGEYAGSCTASGSRLSMAVWGSNDLMGWHLVGTSRHHHLTGIGCAPYRHFRVLVAGWMTAGERLKGVEAFGS